MLKKLNNYIYFRMFISILFIILGIFCAINPGLSFNIISYICICLFIINGIGLLIIDYRTKNIFMNNFLYAIISLVMGIVLWTHPSSLKILIPMIVGTWFTIGGFLDFRLSLYLKDESASMMILGIISSILKIMCGIVLICNPLETLNVIIVTLGIVCIIYSILNIIDMFIIKKHINKIVKNIKHHMKNFIE